MIKWNKKKLKLTYDYEHFEFNYKFKYLIEERKTKYNNIKVLYHSVLGKIILINNDIMSSEFDKEYDKLIIELMPKNVKNVLILWGGDLSLAFELQKRKSVKNINVVEIDKGVIEIYKKYFNYNTKLNKKCRIIIEDAFNYIKNINIKPDIIIDDMTTNPINANFNYYKFIAKVFPKTYIISQTDTKNYIYFEKILKKIKKFTDDFFIKEGFVKTYLENWTFIKYRIK
jgi:spermidine synthase